jgi:signal transduction histidine kinase
MVKEAALARTKQLGVIFAIWTGLAVIAGTQWHLQSLHSGHPVTWFYALRLSLIEHWIYAVLTPFVLWICARLPFGRRGWLLTALVHTLGVAAFLLMFVGIRMALGPVYDPSSGKLAHASWSLFRGLLLEYPYDALWMYGGIVAVSQGWDYYRKYKERELRASRLEAQLAQAQLKMLKMQLDPHFLFNTLHSISSLMHEDVEAADEMVARLSELLRMSLDNMNEHEITLKREMEFMEGYLAIQQTRFRDRLRVCVSIDPRSLDAMVPTMILQPLVENAVRHGVASRSTAGKVEIRSELRDDRLRLEVCDNGPGPDEGRTYLPTTKGRGLANTRARLDQLYGASHQFSFRKPAGGGTIVIMDIPARMKSGTAREVRESRPPYEESVDAHSHDYRG